MLKKIPESVGSLVYGIASDAVDRIGPDVLRRHPARIYSWRSSAVFGLLISYSPFSQNDLVVRPEITNLVALLDDGDTSLCTYARKQELPLDISDPYVVPFVRAAGEYVEQHTDLYPAEHPLVVCWYGLKATLESQTYE